MNVKQEKITPKRAEALLAKNERNWRNLKKAQVALYAREMRDDLWEDSLSMIIIDEEGYVVDGGHRLAAVVESDTSQTFVILNGAPVDVGSKVDIGLPRTGTDLMHHLVTGNYNYWARMTSAVKRWDDTSSLFATAEKMPLPEVERYFLSHPEFRDRAEAALEIYKLAANRGSPIRIPPLQASFMWYAMASTETPELATEFFHALYTGEDLNGTDPRFALREALLAESRKSISSPFNGQAGQVTLRMLLWTAWQKWRDGETIPHSDRHPSRAALRRTVTNRLGKMGNATMRVAA